MAPAPKVSAVLAVLDGERWLQQAVDSVLRQTEADLELIVVDDGSTDGTPAILGELARRDARVRILSRPHRGLVASLNEGLDRAKGRFFARIDADDLWQPRRLEAQLAFLAQNPDVGFLGTAMRAVDANGCVIRDSRRPETDLEIRWKALLWCPFTHSSMLIRREVLDANRLRYDPRYTLAEDFDLWVRLLASTRAANLPETLVSKRRHASYSERNRTQSVRVALQIAARAIAQEAPGFSIQPLGPRDVGPMREAFAGMGNAHIPAGNTGYRLIGRYLDLFESFARAKQDPVGIATIHAFEQPRIRRGLRHEPDGVRLRWLMARLDALEPGARRRSSSPIRGFLAREARAFARAARAGFSGR